MRLRKYADLARYALYDAGNSNYDTLVVAIAFPIFLNTFIMPRSGAAAEASSGAVDFTWGGIVAVGTLLAAILGPKLGVIADRYGARRGFLRYLSLVAIAGTLLFALLPRDHVLFAGTLFAVTHCSFLLAALLYNATLADVSSTGNAAFVSSVAWGVGYLGGLAGLLIALTTGSIEPESARLRILFLVAGGMFLVFSLPLLLARKGTGEAANPNAPKSAWLIPIIRSFMRDAARARFFWAFFLYSNGVNAVIIFTSLYAQKTLKFDINGLIVLFIGMNIVAAPAAMVFGKIAEKFGQLRTLKWIVGAWIALVGLIAWIGLMEDKVLFSIAACCAASLLGPVQAISRSLFRVIFPQESMSTFFGVQALANRSAALVGPLLFGFVSWLTGSQILGALSTCLLFAGGLAALFAVPKNIEPAE